jgi:hypothetical protein
VVLCLRCNCIGAGPLEDHRGAQCLAVDLAQRDETLHGHPRAFSADVLYGAVENFRAAREAADLPHYDLDCYASGGQVTFTWRPLPTDAAR